MLPSHTNVYGDVHGGVIMKIIDETGAIAAMRHAQRPCVTVAIDSMTFDSPVEVGMLLCCTARVVYVGRSSLEVVVRVSAENPVTGELLHTNSGYVVYVALDEQRRPTEVPALVLETEADRTEALAGRERQDARKARRRPRA